MGTAQLRSEWEEARKDRVSLLPSALGDTRDEPSTGTACHSLAIPGLQPLPDVVINAGGLSSH